MARPLRIEYPGAFYHVVNRGQRQEPIVLDRADRIRFLSDVERMAGQFHVLVHSYCLMTNPGDEAVAGSVLGTKPFLRWAFGGGDCSSRGRGATGQWRTDSVTWSSAQPRPRHRPVSVPGAERAKLSGTWPPLWRNFRGRHHHATSDSRTPDAQRSLFDASRGTPTRENCEQLTIDCTEKVPFGPCYPGCRARTRGRFGRFQGFFSGIND